MAIFRRITDMLTANVNDLIERIEDPESLLRQAVRQQNACAFVVAARHGNPCTVTLLPALATAFFDVPRKEPLVRNGSRSGVHRLFDCGLHLADGLPQQ
jgi:hypothetical protein